MNWNQEPPQLVKDLDAQHDAVPRWRFVALFVVCAWAYGAALETNDGWRWHEAGQVWCSTDDDCAAFDEPATCETDTDCEAQCREDLRPDEDEALCDVEA